LWPIGSSEYPVILIGTRSNKRKKGTVEQLQFPELVDIETVAKLLGVGVR